MHKTNIIHKKIRDLGLLLFALGAMLPIPALAAECSDKSGDQTVRLGVDVGCEDKGNVIYSYLAAIVKFLAVGVGIVIVLMIIIGAIQYITSSGNPQAAAAAKGRITNAIIALLLFIFMSAILNFLVPGGIL